MRSLLIMFLLPLFAACGQPDNKPDDLDPAPADVAQTREVYAGAHADGAPIEVDTCDSGHWYFLLGAAETTLPIDARIYMQSDHRVHRKPLRGPLAQPECYPDRSDSTTSGDELLYLLAYGLARGDLQLLKDVFAYGKARDWIMGDGDRFRTVMRPGLRALYARAIFVLGGPDFAERFIPTPESGVQVGYEAQLQVVRILIDGKATGAITDEYREIMQKQRERQPRNPLFACAAARYGVDDMARAYGTLGDVSIFPSAALPTSYGNRCESIVTQRDDGKDWQPCKTDRDGNPIPDRTHSGADFLFALAVCAGRF